VYVYFTMLKFQQTDKLRQLRYECMHKTQPNLEQRQNFKGILLNNE